MFFDGPTAFDKISNDFGEDANLHRSIRKGWQCRIRLVRSILSLGGHGKFRPFVNGGKAQIVFLNQGRVQTVKVQQQNKGIVKAALGVQDQSTTILGLAGQTFASSLLGNQVFAFVKLMQQQILGPLGSVTFQGVGPNISGNGGQLDRQWKNLQFEQESLDQLGVPQGGLRQLDEGLGRCVPGGNVNGENFGAIGLETGGRQVGERVGGFIVQEFLGTQVGIAEQSSFHDIGNVHVLVGRQRSLLDEFRSFSTTQLGPFHIHFEFAGPTQEDFNIVSPRIVPHNHVGIPFANLAKETGEQFPFTGHGNELRHGGTNFAVKVTRKTGGPISALVLRERSNERELCHVSGGGQVVRRGTVQRHVAVTNGRDGNNFGFVCLWVDDGLEFERHGDHGRWSSAMDGIV